MCISRICQTEFGTPNIRNSLPMAAASTAALYFMTELPGSDKVNIPKFCSLLPDVEILKCSMRNDNSVTGKRPALEASAILFQGVLVCALLTKQYEVLIASYLYLAERTPGRCGQERVCCHRCAYIVWQDVRLLLLHGEDPTRGRRWRRSLRFTDKGASPHITWNAPRPLPPKFHLVDLVPRLFHLPAREDGTWERGEHCFNPLFLLFVFRLSV